jgi:hypothetical protein
VDREHSELVLRDRRPHGHQHRADLEANGELCHRDLRQGRHGQRKLAYTSGSTAEPLASQEIWIGNQQWDRGNPVVTGKTGANGTFSIAIPAEQIATPLYVGTLNVFELTAVESPLQLDVVNPTIISSLKVSLNQYWNLSVSGCLGFASGNKAQTFYHTSGLTVQYAATPTGTWKNLFAINGNESVTPCGTGRIKFTGSHAAPGNYAYYRVVYAGTKGATSYAASASGAVLAWRYADRITGLKVSPAVVNAGGKLTVKGTLQFYYGGWHNYGGQIIWIDLRPKGSSTWYWMVKVETNGKGQFSATFKDPVSATWESARGSRCVLDPLTQQAGEDGRHLQRRQMPGTWPVDSPGTADSGDHSLSGVVHRVQVEPAHEDEHRNLDLTEPVEGRRIQFLLLDVLPVNGHLEGTALHAPYAFPG